MELIFGNLFKQLHYIIYDTNKRFMNVLHFLITLFFGTAWPEKFLENVRACMWTEAER